MNSTIEESIETNRSVSTEHAEQRPANWNALSVRFRRRRLARTGYRRKEPVRDFRRSRDGFEEDADQLGIQAALLGILPHHVPALLVRQGRPVGPIAGQGIV